MAIRYWSARAALYEISYDTGTNTPVVGETLNVVGAATETCVVQAWTVSGGSWAGNDATGKIWVYSASAAFVANFASGDDLENVGNSLICNSTSEETLKTGDWQVAGNWGSGEDPAVPVANDTVVFDGRSVIVPTDGMLDSESGATAQCTYDLLHFKEDWAYGVASAAEPLCCSPDKITIDGTGTYYILCGKDNQSTDTDIDYLLINNKNATVYIYSNANDVANTCEFTAVYLTAGSLYESFYSVDTDEHGVYVATLFVAPKDGKTGNATCYIAKDCYKVNGPVAGDIFMSEGTLTTDSMADVIHFAGGTLNYGTDLAASPETDLNIAELYLYGGTFNWYPDDSGDDAFIGIVRIYGGDFLANASTNADRAKTLGGGAGSDMFIFQGAKVDLSNGRGNITLTAGSQLFNYGGTLILDSGADITLTYHTI